MNCSNRPDRHICTISTLLAVLLCRSLAAQPPTVVVERMVHPAPVAGSGFEKSRHGSIAMDTTGRFIAAWIVPELGAPQASQAYCHRFTDAGDFLGDGGVIPAPNPTLLTVIEPGPNDGNHTDVNIRLNDEGIIYYSTIVAKAPSIGFDTPTHVAALDSFDENPFNPTPIVPPPGSGEAATTSSLALGASILTARTWVRQSVLFQPRGLVYESSLTSPTRLISACSPVNDCFGAN